MECGDSGDDRSSRVYTNRLNRPVWLLLERRGRTGPLQQEEGKATGSRCSWDAVQKGVWQMKAWDDNRRGAVSCDSSVCGSHSHSHCVTPPAPMQGSHWLQGGGGGAAGAQGDSGSKEGREAEGVGGVGVGWAVLVYGEEGLVYRVGQLTSEPRDCAPGPDWEGGVLIHTDTPRLPAWKTANMRTQNY